MTDRVTATRTSGPARTMPGPTSGPARTMPAGPEIRRPDQPKMATRSRPVRPIRVKAPPAAMRCRAG